MRFRQSVFLLSALAIIAALVACSSSSKSTPPPPVVSIAAKSGSGQSAVVGAKFAAPLVATVTTGGSPTSAATVTFTAPASGAGGTFANGTATETDTTNVSGVATSSAFTANSTAGGPYTVAASVSGATTTASFSLTNTAAPVESIAATSGTPQIAAISTAFGAQLVATVTTGGTPNSGVTVTFTAPTSGASGTFAGGNTATTDANGVATSPVFTANSTIGAYTVTATVAGVSTAANFNLTNVVATGLANGIYVFSLNGLDQFASTGASCVSGSTDNFACSPYFVAGAFVVSGGTITGGEQDFKDLGLHATDPITRGSVTATADGNLQITLTTADTNIGVNGVETLNATLATASQGLITEFDASATSSGFLAQQTGTVAAPSGGYAFIAAGLDGNTTSGPFPVDIGGVINVDGSGTISGTGSVFDINDDGTVNRSQTFAASTVSAPDSFGRVQFSLVPSATVSPINLVGYIVGPKHIWLVETNDMFAGTMGGEALGQGANTGTFGTTTVVAGSSYVFSTSGADANGVYEVAGVLTLNTDGTTVSGTLNFNDLSGTTTQSTVAVSGTYTVDSTGRVTVSNLAGGGITNAQIYLSGFGDGTVASMDAGEVLAGLANQQTGGGSFTASSFSGLYATNASGFDLANELEFDANGPVSADGVSALSGPVDLNFMTPPGTQTPSAAISGAFTANASGVFTGTITGLDIDTPANNDAFTFYMIDTTKGIAIETDPNQLTLIKFVLQQ
ncbi:MAG TPA: hypothetical protein VMQ17_10885 [Candidatus Sulfotelmatobacter sp.]|jgi:hypothetical protein|nr:hypothetical protein [Candidatus Sulfotelmatobacter sp.]